MAASNHSVTVSNKEMSHDFKIPASQFLKGISNDTALGIVLFLISAFLSVNIEGLNALQIRLLRLSILAHLITS